MIKHLRLGARIVRIAAELSLVLVCVALVLLLALVFRLERGPLDAGFARLYVERALSGEGYQVSVKGLQLEWPHIGGAALLDLTGFELCQNGAVAATVAQAQFGLSRSLLLFGQIAPVSITLTRPNLHLVREAGNRIGMSVESAAATDTEAGQQAFAAVIKTLAAQRRLFDIGNPLAHLRRFDIQDAAVTIDDRVAGQTWHLDHANAVFVHDKRGLTMTTRLRVPGGRHGEALVDAAVNFRRATGDYAVHARLSNVDPVLFSRQASWLAPLVAQDMVLNGDADGLLAGDLGVQRARVTLAAGPGALSLPSLYTQPLPFTGLGIDASYDRAAGMLDVTRLALQGNDVSAVMTGRFTITGGSLHGHATLGIPAAAQARIAALWPDRITGAGQSWLTKKLSGGTLKNIAAAAEVEADLTPDKPLALTVKDVTAEFDAENMTVDYCAPLRPATAAAGHGIFANGTLSIAVASARIGEIETRGGKVAISGLPAHGMADVQLQLAGPAQAALAYIASPPLRIDPERFGMKLDGLRGAAEAALHLRFPTGVTLTPDQVRVTVDGTIAKATLPGAFHGADLAAEQLALHADNDGVELHGGAALAGAPLSFDWHAAFRPAANAAASHLTATLKTTDALRARLADGTPPVAMTGIVPVHLEYDDFGGGKATLSFTADAGAALVLIPALDYRKPVGEVASASAALTLQDGVLRDVQNLMIAAPAFAVAGVTAAFAPVAGKPQLRSLHIARLRLNETDAAIRLDTNAGGARQLVITGKFFDARPFIRRPAVQTPYAGPPMQGNITVAALRAGEARTIGGAALRFSLNGQGMLDSFDMRGTAGAGVLTARLGASPHGGRDLAIKAADGGAALQAMNLYPNAVGGTLSVTGHAAAATPRTIDGRASLRDFNVAHAPVLASILTGLSIAGLPDMLAGNGIHFSSLDSDFTWRAAPMGNLITVRDGRSTGASLGLTFSGDIDTAQNAIDIHGDVVPFSGINGMLNNVPILDDILSGGRHGGIFAATYSITGAPSNPQVSVNPLAALAPGFLRPLLFGR